MTQSIKIPLYKEIKRAVGGENSSCDFCMQKNKDGFVGSMEVFMPVTSSRMVVTDWEFSFFAWNKIIKNYDYKPVVLDWDKRDLQPIVCDDCIRSMYKSLSKE